MKLTNTLLGMLLVALPIVEARLRIVGGSTVTNASLYPYFAAPAGSWTCGSALIWGNILVTAGHCAQSGAWNNGLRLGGTIRDKAPSVFYRTNRTIIHPNFNSTTGANDIALIIINDFVSSTKTPYAIVNSDGTIPSTATNLTTMGFGRLTETGSISNALQHVDLLTESNANCASYWTGIKRFNSTQMVCHRTDGVRDTCLGDSGGPILLKGTRIIVGLTSFGRGCARPNVPAVNTRISTYNDWIRTAICSLNTTGSPLPSYCGSNTTQSV
jgi:secreted trypsin-like serine protease